MSSLSRRAFLSASSLALAGASVGLSRFARALPLRSKQPVSVFFPASIDPTTLRTLAQMGVDAARAAGATYADIRVADVRTLMMFLDRAFVPVGDMDFVRAYGIRVQVDGVWAAAFGGNLTADDIAQNARVAVATAKRLASLAGPRQILVPNPAVHGEWETPVAMDPFAVSPDTYAKLLGAYRETAKRVLGGTLGPTNFFCTAETRVFASTEGSLITQRLTQVAPEVSVALSRPFGGPVILPVPGFVPMSAGLESVADPKLYEQIKITTEDAIRLSSYPEGRAEVGRYEAVLDGTIVGSIMGKTLARALEIERVLGHDTDGLGVGVLAPVDSVLGMPLFSPLLTVTANRTPPHYGAAKWDDEGVETQSFPVITQGRVVDYFTTRATAPMLAAWYAKTKQPLSSRGSAVSWGAQLTPRGCASQLTVEAGSAGTTLDTMLRGITNGVLLRGAQDLESDPQSAGGLLNPWMLYEVKRGQITRRLRGGALQFSTKKLWKAVTALGGVDTVRSVVCGDRRGETWTVANLPVLAPAVQVSQVDVIQIGGGA